MVIQPRPEKIGPQESGSVAGTSDIADGSENARSTVDVARLRELIGNARGHNRTGDYRVEFDDYTGCWAVIFTFDRTDMIFCLMSGTSQDRGDGNDQGRIDAETVAALLNAAVDLDAVPTGGA